MSVEQLIFLKKIVLLVIMIEFFLLIVISSYRKNRKGRFIKDRVTDLERRFKKIEKGYFHYGRISRFLKRNGVTYMFPIIEPVNYIMIKILLCLLSVLVSIGYLPIYAGISTGAAGFFFLDFMIFYSNKSDNESMLPDIEKMYKTIKLQSTAGVYLMDTLSDCYLTVKHGRLKAALLDLTNEILAKKDISQALENFNENFNNRYIDTFCIIITQSGISGKITQMLEDMSSSIEDVQKAFYYKEKEKMDRQIQILELLIYGGLMAVSIFGFGTEVMWAIQNF